MYDKKARRARIGHQGQMPAATHALEAGCGFLYDKKVRTAACFLSLLFFLIFAACATDGEFESGTLDAVVADGLLMPFEDIGDAAAGRLPSPVAVEYRPMPGRLRLNADVGFSVAEELSFELEDRIFNDFYVEPGQFVRAGEILASARRDNTEIFMQRHLRAIDELARFEEDFRDGRDRRSVEIQELRIELETARDWERISLNLAIAEIQYEEFVRNSQRMMRDMRRDIADTRVLTADEYITAPFDGLVIHINRTIRPDLEVSEGVLVAIVADVNTMNLNVQGNMHFLRYDDIVPVIFAEHEFLTRVVSDPFAGGERGTAWFILQPLDSQILPQIFAEFEYDWDAFRHNPSRFAEPHWNMFGDGIWVRQEAVFFEAIRGEVALPGMPPPTRTFVMVYENGVFGRRIITLSPYTFGSYVHVLSGLVPGEIVADAGEVLP
ncbi:MAG: hypothetical protein FWC70_04960 [Defluviitaleaceae bacterium]|nr:hypothetical protein [Defluviitaleaceae bacterium]